MQPTDARRAFPCFDKPGLKAIFIITFIAREDQICLSNREVASVGFVDSDCGKGYRTKAATFHRIPLMSTYLVAFIVGQDLRLIESHDFRVPVRVYTGTDRDLRLANYALKLATKTMKFYEQRYDFRFPMPKLDLFAVPNFQTGAMETEALRNLTSRRYYMTRNLKMGQRRNLLPVLSRTSYLTNRVLVHLEMTVDRLTSTHRFSCLITTDIWDGTCLNEGFATWMSIYALNSLYSEW